MKALGETFRQNGYEGASLSRIATATGLEKASLYHRFPGGKDEMAQAVIQEVGAWMQANVFEPLEGEGTALERVRTMGKRLMEFYGEGRDFCIFDTLSLSGGSPALHEMLHGAMTRWLESMERVAKESGFKSKEARRRAELALSSIEGALICARVLGDTGIFQRAIKRLPELLVKDAGD
jgi:AcrR family transcriptional regulator